MHAPSDLQVLDPKSPPFSVPANASRFFESRDEALRQPVAEIQLGWSQDDPYLRNLRFRPDLVAHDTNYCTSVVDVNGVTQIPTAAYFFDSVLSFCRNDAVVIDIGCGQGEFVNVLRSRGVDAVGFDPVVRHNSEHLVASYYEPGIHRGDLFVMRCVLPHIQDPWLFMEAIGRHYPDALILVEFQRMEWAIERGIWYQLSHDHVNIFTNRDFEDRFEIVAQGRFAFDEWAWVLVRASSYHPADSRPCDLDDRIERLMARRTAALQRASTGGPFAIWGAAGKGIVLAHALEAHGTSVVAAIDADPARHNLFMEVSGVRIDSPDVILPELQRGTGILVANPNHTEAIQDRYGAELERRGLTLIRPDDDR